MKATTTPVEFVLLVELNEDTWGVQVITGEPQPGMICRCVDTGECFRVQIAGSVDARALVRGKRIISFDPILSHPGELRKGYRMVGQPAVHVT